MSFMHLKRDTAAARRSPGGVGKAFRAALSVDPDLDRAMLEAKTEWTEWLMALALICCVPYFRQHNSDMHPTRPKRHGLSDPLRGRPSSGRSGRKGTTQSV